MGDIDLSDLAELLSSSEWPLAVPSEFICNRISCVEKAARAESILDAILDQYLHGLSFLDFGCGEGHVVHAAKAQSPRLSVGFDIAPPASIDFPWEQVSNGTLLTTNWENVRANGPFDVVLVYDVLDHASQSIHPILKRLLEVTTSRSRIFVRCHPWTSRHGAHLYQQLNKAFLQLVFSHAELHQLDLIPLFSRREIDPIPTYRTWFHPLYREWRPEYMALRHPVRWPFDMLSRITDQSLRLLRSGSAYHLLRKSGLRAELERVDRSDVDSFFLTRPTVEKRIRQTLKMNGISPRVQTDVMSVNFVDYILVRE